MSFALKGAITGIAAGLSERIDEEKKETRELLALRTKNAYQNYLTYQEKVNSLKDEIKKRDQQYLSIQPDLTEQERVALATMPNALEIYTKAVNAGKAVNLRDIIMVPNANQNLTFDEFMKGYGKIEAAKEVAFKTETPKSFFAPSEQKQRQYMDRLSSGLGVRTEELMAYEQAPESPYVKPMGSFKPEMLQEDKTFNQQVDQLMTQIASGKVKGENVTAYQTKLDSLLEVKGNAEIKNLDPDQKRERRKAELMTIVESATATPQEKKSAQQELLKMANTEKMYALASTIRTDTVDKPASMAQFKGVVSMATGSAGKVVQGVGKLVNLETNPYAPPIYTIDGTEEAKRRFNEERDRLIGIALRTGGYVDKNGKLLDNDYAAVLSSAGIDVQIREDGGRYVMENSKAAQARRNGSVSEIIAFGISKGMSDVELMEQGFLQEEINSVKNVNARGRR